jgi:hypothetical protein
VNTDRYRAYGASELLCLECSTRTTAVAIPADERQAHDLWHAQGGDQWIPWDPAEQPAHS